MPALLVPILSGTALFSGTLFGVSTAVIAANIIVGAASLAATYALSKLGSKRAPGERKAQEFQDTIRQAVAPRRRSYGTVMVSGPMAFYEARGDFVYILVLMNEGTIEQIDEWHIADRQVVVDGSGDVLTPPYRLNNGAVVRLEWGLGFADQAASPMLRAAFSEWTTNHKLSGIAWTLMRLRKVPAENFQAIYNNTTPSVRQVMRSSRVFDPRAENQILENPSTWRSSRNPVIQALDYMTNKRGMFLARDLFDVPTFSVESDICDATVPLKGGGSIRRYESSGTYELTEAPDQVLERILATCGGALYLRPDGKIGIEVDRWYEPEDVITERDIRAWDINSGVTRLQRYRAVRAKYTSPPHGYKEQTAAPVVLPSVTVSQAIIQDFDLPWVNHNQQALRLAKQKLYRDNADFSGTLTLGPTGLRLIGKRRFRLTAPTLLDIDHACEIKRWSVTADLTTVTVEFSTLSLTGYSFDPNTEEVAPSPLPPDTRELQELASPQNVRALSGKRGADMWSGVAWDMPATRVQPEFRFREQGASVWGFLEVASTRNFIEFEVTEDTDYEAEVRFVDGKGNITGWVSTQWTAVDDQTIPPAPTNFVAVGGAEYITASALQSTSSAALALEFFEDESSASSPPVSEADAIGLREGQASGERTFESETGERKVWAFARTVANNRSPTAGPLIVTVSDVTPLPTGSGGSGDSGTPAGESSGGVGGSSSTGGASGTTGFDGSGPTGFGDSGGGSSGGGGGDSGTGGLY